MRNARYLLALGASMSAMLLSSAAIAQDATLDLKDAVAAALKTNPEINQAIQNKEATEFERVQAQGQFLPRVSIEGSGGVRRLENNTRRVLGIANKTLYPVEGGLSVDQIIFDSGARSAELKRQAARTDGASFRVEERSQFIALNVARQYINYLLQQRVVAAAQDNATFHRQLAGDLREGVQKGSISIADQQQAEERLKAAEARVVEATEDMEAAAIQFRTLTGLDIGMVRVPEALTAKMPPTLDGAVDLARTSNPKVLEAQADVNAAQHVIDAARAQLGPTVSLEGRGRIGNDIDGFEGQTNDLQGRVVFRWNLFTGGINKANVQEQIRRASEARYRLHQMQREAEEEVRSAWSRLSNQSRLLAELEDQSKISDDLLLSYREQFNVGRRSLLDVLDSQNTRYNVQVSRETARFSQMFAQYRLLAATDKLLDALNLAAPAAAHADATSRFKAGPPAPAELQRRVYPTGNQ
ncbi:MAG: TolC family outer membrane protein [Sphingomonas sp.]